MYTYPRTRTLKEINCNYYNISEDAENPLKSRRSKFIFIMKILDKGVLTLLCVIAFPLQACCNNKLPKPAKIQLEADSVFCSIISDSIADILIGASKISIYHYSDSIVDSVRVIDQWVKCNSEQQGIVKMALMNSEISRLDSAYYYGHFSPQVKYVFSKKGKSCAVEIDFGLNVIRLYDAEKQQINEYLLFDKLLLKQMNLFIDDQFLKFLLTV